jgi:transcription factor C subunit 7
MLHTQFRLSFQVDPATGVYTSGPGLVTPTGLPADVTLTAHGVEQAHELADHLAQLQPPIDRVYSSPYYRCLQTIEPFVQKWKAATTSNSSWTGDSSRLQIKAETGLVEWYGTAPFDQPLPASTFSLKGRFPDLDLSYKPVLEPPRRGETIAQLHDRLALAIGRIIDQCDAEGVRTVLLCTHAAAIIALGRVLTGNMPDDADVEDFRAFTCGLSSYHRRTKSQSAGGASAAEDDPKDAERWRHGHGVRGGWKAGLNSDCSFLSAGEERGWYV